MIVFQVMVMVILFADLLLAAHRHGKEKEGRYDFWVTFFAYAITIVLLVGAGTFDQIFK